MMKIFTLIKHYCWILLIPIIILIYIYIFIYQPKPKVIKELVELPVIKEEIVLDTIMVDVKGYVNNPGVYTLTSGSRLIDAVNASGGFKADVDTSTINLSKILKDEMVIIIYSKAEIKSMKKGNTTIKYVDKVCICPVVTNNACIDNKITNGTDNPVVSNPVSSNLVSINNGTLAELDTLPGIGPAKAQDIINYRLINSFKNIEELKNVSGIGDATYDQLKGLITL